MRFDLTVTPLILEQKMITPIYAAILGLIFIFLSYRVIKKRVKHQIGMGDGEQPELTRAIRVHGNFAEFIPFALLLIFFLETQTNHTVIVHLLGIALVIGRLIHAYSFNPTYEEFRFRQIGMVLTFIVIIASAIRILLSYL